MRYLTISFTHKNTEISIREKLSFSDDNTKINFLKNLIACPNINEVMLLSTCNRVEIFANTKECKKSSKLIIEELSKVSQISEEELLDRGDLFQDNGAIHHLFSVASSLDSLVVGETQISGQLKNAYEFAFKFGFCGQKLSRAMHCAFRCAAVVRNETDISKSPISVSSVAVSKAKEMLGTLERTKAVVIGAAEMSELCCKHLVANSADVVVLNRNYEKAKELAQKLNIKADSLDKLEFYINNYNLIFSATGSQTPIITQNLIKEQNFNRYFFDIAVPRDIEIYSTDKIYVYAVDDLQEIVNKNLSLREEQAKIAFAIVGRATMDFFKWLQTLSIEPIIKEIRDIAREVAQTEINKAIRKGYLKGSDEKEVAKVVHQVFNAFLHKPTKNLKQVSELPQADTIVQAIQYFFDINEEKTKYINNYKCEYQMEKDI